MAFAAEIKAGRRQHHEAHRHNGQKQRQEFSHGELELGIEEEVLRIAHGGCHAAEVGGDGLQAHHRDDEIAAIHHFQHQHGKGHKGDERHVVGHQHGGEKRQDHQNQRNAPDRQLAGEELLRQHQEYACLLEPCHHCHEAEEEAKYSQVDVREVGRRGLDPKGGNHRADKRNGENRLTPEK